MRDLACIKVGDASAVGEAKRRAVTEAVRLGLEDEAAGRVAIVVAELASNMVKHAGGGTLLVRALAWSGSAGVELLALDNGPGMLDVEGSMRDGYSTAGSPGTGLGAARRLSALLEIYSGRGRGTAVLSRIWQTPPPATLPPRPLTIGAVCVPAPGETVCGDGWAVHQTGTQATVLVVDGLGHGAGAADAADQAVLAFRRDPAAAPEVQLAALDTALRATRGAAAAVAAVTPADRTVDFAALGNVAARVHGGESAHALLSCEGTAGMGRRRARQTTYAWPGDAMLIVHTDGITSRWSLSDYPGLHHRHPSLIAGVLFRDHRRGRDDATVLVAVPTRKES